MNSLFLLSIFFSFLVPSENSVLTRISGGEDVWSDLCTDEVLNNNNCKLIQGLKIWRHVKDISQQPEFSRNMTLTELKRFCDDRFVCLENTYCYKDSYNYELLDECIEEIFQKGPMGLCVKTLKEVMDTQPNKKIASCVKEHLKKWDTITKDCKIIKETGDCLLPDIGKYCDPKFLPVFKQYLSLRLYNLACDGRLRYRVPGDRPQNVLNATASTNQTEIF